MWSLPVFVVALIIVYVTHWLYRWTYPKCSGILPPGSSGFPLIGETLQLNSLGLPSFLRARLEKYGPLFRTNIAGRHVIVSADAEINHFLLQQDIRWLENWHLDSLGKPFRQGESGPEGNIIRMYYKGIVLRHFGVDRVKERLMPQFEGWVRRTLRSWSSQDSIEVKDATDTMFLQIGLKLMFSCNPKESKDFVEKYLNSPKSFKAFPLNIPGTTYSKTMMKNRERVLEMLRCIMRAKLASGKNSQEDLLDQILADMNREKFLTEDFIVELMFRLIYVIYDSAAWIFALTLKFVSENPSVLQELMVEHEEILKKKENLESSITWEEYKSMNFTRQVINESLRLGTSAPGFLRKAKKDFEINGYTIPAGWGILVAISPVHLNPEVFKNPLEYNPRRWKDIPQQVVNKNLTPFGGGIKQCVGEDYTKVLLSIFLHVLVTEYRWTKLGGGEIVQDPLIRFRNDLRIKVTKKQK